MQGETPVSLSALFGSDKGLILLPSAAPEQLGQGYARLARAWQAGHPDWRIARDDAIASLPNDRPVWLLGWENRHLDTFGKDATGFSLDIPARLAGDHGRRGARPARAQTACSGVRI